MKEAQRLKKEVRQRVDAIARKGTYTEDDLIYFEYLYWTGRTDLQEELKSLLGVIEPDF